MCARALSQKLVMKHFVITKPELCINFFVSVNGNTLCNQGLENYGYRCILFYFKSVIVFVYLHFDPINVMELEACTLVFMVQSVRLTIRVLSHDHPTDISII